MGEYIVVGTAFTISTITSILALGFSGDAVVASMMGALPVGIVVEIAYLALEDFLYG